MLGCVVSLTSSHLSGSTIRDVNAVGSVLCSNSSFSSLLSSPNTDSSASTATSPADSFEEPFDDRKVYSFTKSSGTTPSSALFWNCHFTGPNYQPSARPLTFTEYPGTISILSCSFSAINFTGFSVGTLSQKDLNIFDTLVTGCFTGATGAICLLNTVRTKSTKCEEIHKFEV
ncbi:hypothetical protein BLNAU_19005 [Blattamonas nauphoetae]|uniref:Uncharacterized protein n=1 Tax=Blattamonas nauphoetae TaxID=2049346 RepID=A0ABQ9X2U9_9EUKA|nr:hypothetical protein BLNAU_19005 [Blattamonas nauphoetae]